MNEGVGLEGIVDDAKKLGLVDVELKGLLKIYQNAYDAFNLKYSGNRVFNDTEQYLSFIRSRCTSSEAAAREYMRKTVDSWHKDQADGASWRSPGDCNE